MQFIEATQLSVRSAVWVLRRRGTPLRFHLFSMVHIGSQDFYDEVARRIGACDLVVAEGAGQPRKPLGQLRLRVYRLLFRGRLPALVYQHIDYAALGVPVIWPDMVKHDPSKATAARRQHSRKVRLQFVLLVLALPFLMLYLLLRGSRRFLADSDVLNVDDDTPFTEGGGHLTDMILDDRDDLLLQELCRIHEERASESLDVAVVYGAMHMPAVVHGLHTRYGYRPGDGTWLTVHGLSV